MLIRKIKFSVEHSLITCLLVVLVLVVLGRLAG